MSTTAPDTGVTPSPGSTIEGPARRGWQLLLAVASTLALGSVLLLTAKGPALSAPGAVDLNRATRAAVASALGGDEQVARRLLFQGSRRRRFGDVDAVREVRLLSAAEAERTSAALRALGSGSSSSAARLAASARLPLPVARRVLETASPDSPSVAALLSVRVISRSLWSAHRQSFVVRSGRAFVSGYLIALALLLLAFALAHRVVVAGGARHGRLLMPLLLLLVGVSVITLASIKDPLRDGLAYQHQAWGAGAGLLAMLVASRLSFSGLRRFQYLFAVAAVTIIALLLVAGTGPGRLALWSVQPMEAVKILLVLFAASYLAEHGTLLEHRVQSRVGFLLPNLHDIGPLLAAYGFALFALFAVRDLGPVLILFGVLIVMLYVSTGRPLYPAAGLALVASLGVIGYATGLGVIRTRVDMWLSPWHNAHAGGEQLAHAYWAVASGGIAGSGLGLGSPASIPRAGSDLVLASIAEQLGPAGIVLVLAALLTVLQRSLRTCAACAPERTFESLLGVGLVSLLGFSGLLIACGTAGLLPLTGVAFPFVCYGNSSLLAACASIGVVLSLDREAGARTPQPRRVRARLRGLAILAAAAALLVALRFAWMAGPQADRWAGRAAWSQDADGVTRSHVNPRLLALADQLPAGRILDRAGRVVAEGGGAAGAHRRYPYGAALAHLVGYTDPRYGGPTGLERTCGTELRGFGSYAELVPMLRAKDLPWRAAGPRPRDVRMTVDASLQRDAARALHATTRRLRDKRTGRRKQNAAAVVLDMRTGGVLAAVSRPSYDPNALSAARWHELTTLPPEESILLDRSRYGLYPPGSAFKVVTAAAALDAGIEHPVVCQHAVAGLSWTEQGKRYGPRTISDFEQARAHGMVGMRPALAYSCNVYFCQLGIALGASRLHDFVARLALEKPAPLEAVAAALPDAAIGQGPVLVTPMEMARVAAMAANGGILVAPRVTQEATQEARRVLSEEAARHLRSAMRDVVTVGTARGRFAGLPFSVAGKTGSAENDQGDGRTHSWFVGFAPADRPQVAVAVIVENGGLGAEVAAPAAREILRAWWQRRERQ